MEVDFSCPINHPDLLGYSIGNTFQNPSGVTAEIVDFEDQVEVQGQILSGPATVVLQIRTPKTEGVENCANTTRDELGLHAFPLPLHVEEARVPAIEFKSFIQQFQDAGI